MSPTAKNWILAIRPWSFPASTMPALLVISYVFLNQKTFDGINWWYGVIALLGAVIFHASGNLVSDFFDYKYKVDRKESFGSSRMLVDGVFTPKAILSLGVVFMLVGILIGLFLLFNTGIDLLWIGAIGVLGTFFYYKFKFAALGDLLILIIYGPLIGFGTAFVMTNQLLWEVILLTIPVALLVVNILHANNTRDIRDDGKAKIKTLAMKLGVKGSKVQYILNAMMAYVVVSLMVVFGMLHPLSLAVFVTLPLALKNIKTMQLAEIEKPELIKDLDGDSAKLVMAFSLLFSLSNFIAYYL